MNKLIILLKLKKKQYTSRRVAKLSAVTARKKKLTQSALSLNKSFVSSMSPPQSSSLLLASVKTVSSKSVYQSADLSDTKKVFNQFEKSNFYSFLNLTSKLNNNDSVRSDTLEQMYNDNNTFNETFSSTSTSSTNNSSSSIGTDNTVDTTNSKITTQSNSNNQLGVKLKSILKPFKIETINNTTLVSNVSILKLEQEIRSRIESLRQYAVNLNLNTPINLSMLEAMYDLKMDGLKQEAKNAIKQFDKKSSDHERNGNINLNKFFRLLKNFNGKSRRTRSLNSSPNKNESPLNTPEIKHKNYYSFERDNLERSYEARMRTFQYEILFLINDIEVQFKELKRASREQSGKVKTIGSKKALNREHQSRRKTGTLTKKQRILYSTEAIIQKRIRIHKSQYSYDKNSNSMQTLTASEIIQKNKNPLAFETMV